MPVRRLIILVSVLAAVLAARVLPAAAANVYRAERFHSRIVVEPNGAIVLTETLRFVFGPDSFTYVYRELPTRRTDGIIVLQAMMDGLPVEQGKQAGQFEVRRSDEGRRRIVWHFAPTSNSAHTFSITYRAAGVIWQDAGRDVLAWNLLPTKHDYFIECASGEVEYPASAQLLASARFDPPADETQVEGRAVRFLRCPFERDRSWVVSLDFAAGTVAATAPEWQQRQQRNRENMPMFLGLSALILLGGIGGFTRFALTHRHSRTDDGGALASPPEALSPVLAGTLLHTGASAGWGPVLGGVMDLARRGALSIQSVEGTGLFKSHEVRVIAGPTPPDAASHERVLLDLLFTTKAGPRTSVTFSELARTFASSRRWKRLREAIASDLRAARLIDAEREHTRGRVTWLGLALLVAAFAGLVVCVPLLDRLGESLLALPIALLIVGVVAMITGATWSPLSEEGHKRAERWRAFKRSLGDVSESPGGSAPTIERLERWLPYAVAFGTAHAWLKRLQKQGIALGPSWLTAVSREGAVGQANLGATIAVISAGSSAGAHAGGGAAGAAGAAGGGASGAG